jgi:hypothetical protein
MAPLLGEWANLQQNSRNSSESLSTDDGSDAPLIKKIGVQPNSEVYGAFVKATEAGEEVRYWSTFIGATHCIPLLWYSLTPVTDTKVRRVEDASQQERPGADVQEGRDQWCSSYREHRGRSQGVSSGVAEVPVAEAAHPVPGTTVRRSFLASYQLFRTRPCFLCTTVYAVFLETRLTLLCDRLEADVSSAERRTKHSPRFDLREVNAVKAAESSEPEPEPEPPYTRLPA